MNYEKEYKKLKADIEKAYLFAQTDSTKAALEHILPELKESEDERIRKRLIFDFQVLGKTEWGGLKVKDILAWLEKQKVTDEEIIFRPVVGTDIRIAAKQALERIDIGKKVVLAFNGAYIPVNGKTVGEIDSEYDAWLKKQGGKKETLCDKCRKEQPSHSCQDITALGRCAIENQEEPQVYEIEDGKVITYSETGGYKVIEPKFKVGDWIVTDKNHIWLIDKDCSTTGHSYRLISQNGKVEVGDYNIVDEHAHLWSIKDAKDGDVLTDDYGIYIFDRFDEYDERCFLCMGAYQYSQKVFENEHMLCSVEVHPATKEQRDLLSQKMNEAGYTFDFEKKELKKIEQKSAEDSCKNSDDITIEEKDMTEYKKGFECGKQRVLKYPEDFGLCKKTLTAWSEEDEKMLNDAIGAVGAADYYTYDDKVEIERWLKSLKQRIKGE